jgi:hypothetical protein
MTVSSLTILSIFTVLNFISILIILETINFQDAHLPYTRIFKSEFSEPVCLDI